MLSKPFPAFRCPESHSSFDMGEPGEHSSPSQETSRGLGYACWATEEGTYQVRTMCHAALQHYELSGSLRNWRGLA